MSSEEFYFKNLISPSDRYLKLHNDLVKYLNNPTLALYFTFIVNMSKYADKPWFALNNRYMKQHLPRCITNRQARRRMDKKLVSLGLIKLELMKTKLYCIDKKGFKKLEKHMLEGESVASSKMEPTSSKMERRSIYIPNTNISITKVIDNTSLTRREKISNSLNGKPERVKELKLKHRRYISLEHEIINYWNNPDYSAFFAKVNKRQPVIDILKRMVSNNLDLTESQYSDIALSITQAISKAHQHFTNPAFLFGQRRKTSLKAFLTPLTRHSPKAYEALHGCSHLFKKPKTWCHVFMCCPNDWLSNKLLKRVNVNVEKHFNAKLIQVINVSPSSLDNKGNALLRRAIELAQAFQDVNEFSVLGNLEDYIMYSRGKPQLYWFASKNFWNNTLTNWIVENNRAEGAAKI